MADRDYYYERYNTETNEIDRCPIDDKDGKITGKCILNVVAYFDENPEIRKALGWVKHITKDTDKIDYNKQTQFLVRATNPVDEYTVEDVYHVLTKSEDQLAFEEMLAVAEAGMGFVFM